MPHKQIGRMIYFCAKHWQKQTWRRVAYFVRNIGKNKLDKELFILYETLAKINLTKNCLFCMKRWQKQTWRRIVYFVRNAETNLRVNTLEKDVFCSWNFEINKLELEWLTGSRGAQFTFDILVLLDDILFGARTVNCESCQRTMGWLDDLGCLFSFFRFWIMVGCSIIRWLRLIVRM